MTSTGTVKRPSAPVARGSTYRSTEIRAPETGLPPTSSRPPAVSMLLPDGSHARTAIGPPVTSRAPRRSRSRSAHDLRPRRRDRRREDARRVSRRERCARDRRRRLRLLLAAADGEDLELGQGAAVRRGRRASDRDREVLLAAVQVQRRAGRDRRAGLEPPEHLSGLDLERAQDAVTAAGEREPACGCRHPSPLRLRRLELPDAPAGRDVDRADRAVVVPAREVGAEVPVLQPEEDVALDQLPLLLGRRQLVLDQDAQRSRRQR